MFIGDLSYLESHEVHMNGSYFNAPKAKGEVCQGVYHIFIAYSQQKLLNLQYKQNCHYSFMLNFLVIPIIILSSFFHA
jgi:hypothetical protein